MSATGWGLIGPGAIAVNFANGLAESGSGRLVAVASRSADRRNAFADRFDVPTEGRFDSYEALCAADAVQAVHIATPHPFHARPAPSPY